MIHAPTPITKPVICLDSNKVSNDQLPKDDAQEDDEVFVFDTTDNKVQIDEGDSLKLKICIQFSSKPSISFELSNCLKEEQDASEEEEKRT